MKRRDFIGLLGAGAALGVPAGAAGVRSLAWSQAARHTLPDPPELKGHDLTLTARPSEVDIGLGRVDAWTLNGSMPGPTLRLTRGSTARVRLVNELPEPTILHWHGLDVPEAADGHPRLAIAPGASYDYELPVIDRAGTYWYHPHTHGLTAPQVYRGMAGLLIVDDARASALPLPSGGRELPLILQDKRLAGSASLRYAPSMPDRMMGYLGDTAFGNGVANPTRRVARAAYRLRVLNASSARIFDLAFDPAAPVTLIGSDGGLLQAPERVQRIMLGTGERADLVVDFSRSRPGDRILLRSRAFDVPGMMGMMMGMGRGRMGRGMRGGAMAGSPSQGSAMDLVAFVVDDTPREPAPALPARLSELAQPDVGPGTPRRAFRFRSMMMSHTINGSSFEIDRVDQRIRRGRTEVWSLINDSELPHPVHVHAGQFRVLARTGGRNRIFPWETGPKDTVLVFPQERVDIAVRFDHHVGLFLLHCHNLEHEDMGMMLNFEVVA